MSCNFLSCITFCETRKGVNYYKIVIVARSFTCVNFPHDIACLMA